VQADYASGTGSKTLTFTYTILAGQTDADGVSVSADSLTLNGGTIVSKDSNSALILSHDLVSDSVNFLVDTTAPATTVSNIGISVDTGSSAADFITKTASQTITATLSASLVAGEVLLGSVDGGSTWTDITTSASGTAISWTGATLAGSSSIQLKVSDAAGNDGAVQSQTYVLDTSAPTLSSSTPTDGASAIAIASNIVLTFSETVSAGTGNIVISNGTDTRTISVSDSQVTISGNKVTINPLTDLTAGSNYHVKVDATALKDSAGNDFAGISNTTDLNFSTAAAPSKLYYTVGMVNGSAAVWKEDVDASTGSFLSGTAGVFDGNDIQLQATDFLGSGFKQITAANASVNDVTVRFNIVNGERLDLSGFGSGDKVIIDMQTHASTFMGITYPAGFANATNVRSIKKIQFSTSAFYKGFEAKTGAGGGLRKYVGIAVGGSARAGIYYSCNNIGVPISIAIGFNRNNSSLEYLLP
jgi:methionine-rich copper-binding protein CopC